MKKYQWILIPIVLVTAGIWIWQTRLQAGNASTSPHETNESGLLSKEKELGLPSITEIIKNMRLTKRRSLDKKAIQLVGDVRTNIKNGDIFGFHSAMDAICIDTRRP